MPPDRSGSAWKSPNSLGLRVCEKGRQALARSLDCGSIDSACCSNIVVRPARSKASSPQRATGDSFESTEVSASKATESRNEVQKVSEKTPSQNHQQKERARSHKQHEVRNQKRRERRTNSPESLVTKIETSKMNHEVVNDTRGKTSESQPRSSTEDKS